MKTFLSITPIRFCVLVVVLLTNNTSFSADKVQKVIDIGSHKQLFVDNKFIESSSGVELVMNKPRRTGKVVLKADAPWETYEGAYINSNCTVMKEDGKVRLWYELRDKRTKHAAYAESTDGINFTKPILNLHPLNGSTANNLVMLGKISGASVWKDTKSPPEKRYRSQTKGYNKPTAGRLYCYYSADGIHWTLWQYQKVSPCDTQNIVFWDKSIGRYVLYTRKNPGEGTPARSRYIRRLDSADLENWENEVIVMKADEIDNATHKSPTPQPPLDYYGGTIFKYPDDDGVYIMLAHAYWHWKVTPEQQKRAVVNNKPAKLLPSVLDDRLAVSRDGVNFQRKGGRKPFMSLGPEGSFDSQKVWAIPNPIRMGDELWIYYVGSNRKHRYVKTSVQEELDGVGLAILRLDGFVSADARYSGGEIVTPLIKFEGKKLELNLDTSGGGCVKVELQDQNGKPIAGFTEADSTPHCGNSVRMPVTWGQKGDVSKLAGKPVKIRFVMQDCKLYAFQFIK